MSLLTDGVGMGTKGPLRVATWTERTGDVDLVDFYAAHFGEMSRLAGFLLGGSAHAEDVAQDAFVKLAAASSRLREPDRALAYLRKIVVNACRSARRHDVVVDAHAHRFLTPEGTVSAEELAFTAFDRDDLVQALRALSRRRREVVVLRYYCDMSEGMVADLLGISAGSVKSFGSRGLAELAEVLGGRR